MSIATASLGEIAEVAAGGGAPQDADAFAAEGTPFIRAGSLNPLVNGASESTLEQLTDEVAREHRLRKFPRDTVVFAKSGMSATKGHVYRLRNEAYVVNHLAAIVPTKRVVPEFLEHSLRVFSPVRLIQDAAYPSVRLSDVAMMQIPLPPLAEQRRIAEVLDKAEALRAKRRAALAQLDSLTQSLFLDLFGDPITNQKGFPISRMGDVCDVRDGTHDSPKYVSEGGYPLVTSKNLTTGVVDLSDVNYISEKDYEQINRRSKVDRGDIIMPMIGTIGSPVLVEDEPRFAIKNVALIKFTEASPLPIFVRHLLSSHYFDHLISQKNRGGTQKFVSLGDLRGFKIPFPPLDLQREFARRVAAVEKLKTAQRTALAELDALFASLQHRAFRGEL